MRAEVQQGAAPHSKELGCWGRPRGAVPSPLPEAMQALPLIREAGATVSMLFSRGTWWLVHDGQESGQELSGVGRTGTWLSSTYLVPPSRTLAHSGMACP